MTEALSPALGKMSDKIIAALRQNPSMTIAELARRFGVTTRSIERHLHTLQVNGRFSSSVDNNAYHKRSSAYPVGRYWRSWCHITVMIIHKLSLS
ncbi:MAG: HTH domain-containing protein [Chlorobium sp.]